MKSASHALVGLSLAIAISSGANPCAASEPKLLRFSTVQEVDQLVGPSKQVLMLAYRNLNIEFEAIALPLARSLLLANSGEFDGELGRSQSVESELPNLRRVPTPIGSIDYIPYAMKSVANQAASWTTLKESKLRVGARIGDVLTEKNLGEAIASRVSTYESLFKMLAINRIDIVIAPQGELQRLIPQFPQEMQKKLKDVVAHRPLVTVPIYHFLHLRNKDLIGPVDRELQQMTKDGRIKVIWGLTQ